MANCISCGKELVERSDEWFTWDADILTTNPRPQLRQGRGKRERQLPPARAKKKQIVMVVP